MKGVITLHWAVEPKTGPQRQGAGRRSAGAPVAGGVEEAASGTSPGPGPRHKDGTKKMEQREGD